MNDTIRKQYDEIVKKMLDDPSAEVKLFRGTRQTNEPGSENPEFEATDQMTIVIEVNGGANNVRITSITTEDDET